MASVTSPSVTSNNSMDHFVRSYGDLLFDLCDSLLQNQAHAQIAFRSILKKIRSGKRFQKYNVYERSWVLRIACDKLLQLCRENKKSFSPQEQMQLDAQEKLSTRLKQFPIYFSQLMPEDQLLLLLKDKYGVPFSEISTALGIPEGSLKVRRQQALRTLEEWLWNTK